MARRERRRPPSARSRSSAREGLLEPPADTAGSDAARARRHRPGAPALHHGPPTVTSPCLPASPSSTRPAGTASRSTRPAAGTAPARSARYGSPTARWRWRPGSTLDARAFDVDELKAGWRLACRAAAVRDLRVEVPPLTTRPKAATVGVGRQVILRPAVQKRYVELDEPTLADQRPDIDRLTQAIDDLEVRPTLHALRRLPQVLRRADFKVTAVVVDELLIDVEEGDTTGDPARDRVRPRHHDRRRDPARPVDRHPGRRALDAQQAAAARRRRDQPDQRDHARPRRAAPAAGSSRTRRSTPWSATCATRPASPASRSTRSRWRATPR